MVKLTIKGQLTLCIATAFVLWFLMFSPWTAHWFNFWLTMTASGITLTSMAIAFGGNPFKSSGTLAANTGLLKEVGRELLLGTIIAIVLWNVFWVGDKVSQMLFSFARPQVDMIYGMKDGQSACVIAALLLCIIGPAEEMFWRGYIQRTLCKQYSALYAFVITFGLYTLVHLPSGNFMLIMAALTCGILWGGLYYLIPRHFPAIIISHALWDAAAFVWFPL